MTPGLFYDSETTGLPKWDQPSESPEQPHIVQLAAVLMDLDSRKMISSMNVIIRPDGWTIPPEMTEIHGITTEHALAVGVPENLAIDMLFSLWNGRPRIGHNEGFDARIVRIAQMRFPKAYPEPLLAAWKEGKSVCTAQLSKPILNLGPTEAMKKTNFKVKTPNLGEAYRHFFGKGIEGAHTAMADVKACIDVYFAIQDMQKEQAA